MTTVDEAREALLRVSVDPDRASFRERLVSLEAAIRAEEGELVLRGARRESAETLADMANRLRLSEEARNTALEYIPQQAETLAALREAAANVTDRRTLLDDGFWVSQKEMRALDAALAATPAEDER